MKLFGSLQPELLFFMCTCGFIDNDKDAYQVRRWCAFSKGSDAMLSWVVDGRAYLLKSYECMARSNAHMERSLSLHFLIFLYQLSTSMGGSVVILRNFATWMSGSIFGTDELSTIYARRKFELDNDNTQRITACLSVAKTIWMIWYIGFQKQEFFSMGSSFGKQEKWRWEYEGHGDGWNVPLCAGSMWIPVITTAVTASIASRDLILGALTFTWSAQVYEQFLNHCQIV